MIERRDEQFSTMKEAAASGAVERGIVPAWIPEEATQLRVGYDLDTSERWLRFSLPEGLDPEWPSACEQTSASRVRPAFEALEENVGWWPSDLDEALTDQGPGITVLDCARGAASDEFLIVDAAGAGYFWSAPR